LGVGETRLRSAPKDRRDDPPKKAFGQRSFCADPLGLRIQFIQLGAQIRQKPNYPLAASESGSRDHFGS
jgi:hypothetical protein